MNEQDTAELILNALQGNLCASCNHSKEQHTRGVEFRELRSFCGYWYCLCKAFKQVRT